ncbi:DNA helicase [Melia azedarach]|uniref:DNA helicase n=1 Tax=Melia azedarach TaxID=155640 RepID=A0ACC1XIQ4_MELAZ|nr:DNA helicase [Melia azedarach]
MIVRQLEALIRLSGAIARSHSETQVHPLQVHVAVRLLKSFVISVKSCEIDLFGECWNWACQNKAEGIDKMVCGITKWEKQPEFYGGSKKGSFQTKSNYPEFDKRGRSSDSGG